MSDTQHSPEVQKALDENHLKLLQIFHIIQGVLKAAGTFFVILYFGLIGLMFSNPAFIEASSSRHHNSDAALLPVMGGVFTIIGAVVVIFMVVMTALSFFQAHCFAKRKHSLLCLILAAFDCLWVPYGTLLGVFTFMVLFRPSVKTMFEEAKQLKQLGTTTVS